MRNFLRTTLLACGLSLCLVAAGFAGPWEDGTAAYRSGDYATALKILRPLAKQGDAKAQFILGTMYYAGQGVTQDSSEAVKWYRKAAEQGVVKAQYILGVMYAEGKDVPQDFAEAVKWYRKAAEQGHVKAQYSFGAMYAKSRGVPQNLVEAHKWFNLAARRLPASQEKERDVAIKARNIISSKMTPAQIAEAQQLAREWKPKQRQDEATQRIAGERIGKARNVRSRSSGFGAYLGQFLDTFLAHLSDPLIWVAIILAIGAGWAMIAWYWLILLVALSAVLNLFVVYEQWTKLFRPDEIAPRSLRLFLIHLIIVFTAYGLAYGLAYLRSGKRVGEGQPEAPKNEKSPEDQEAVAAESPDPESHYVRAGAGIVDLVKFIRLTLLRSFERFFSQWLSATAASLIVPRQNPRPSFSRTCCHT